MMPWEHAIIGYIGFSVLLRFGSKRPPTGAETAVVLFASLLPDLVDKPLAWQFNLFPSGHAIGHSIFVALPVVAAALFVAHRRNSPRTGAAFGAGYLLHLPADVVPQTVRSGELLVDRVLWPLEQSGSGYDSGFQAELTENLTAYFSWIVTQLTSGDPEPYSLVLFGLLGGGFLLWMADGMPLGRDVYRAVRRRTSDR